MVNSITTVDLIKSALDVTAIRHQVIANNIANARTSGFMAQRLDFDAALNSVMEQRNSESVLSRGRGYEANLLVLENSNEPVALDSEISLMAENTLRYQILLEGLNRHTSLVRLAITEGR